jgi:acyl-CoA thioester hydrolase
MSEPTDPVTYAHWVSERVRFSDTDAMGHANNVGLAAVVESGRVAYVAGLLGRLDSAAGAFVLRRLEVDYLSEARYPEQLRVGSRLLSVGRTSFTVGTGVFAEGRCVATSTGVLVLVGPDGPAPIDGPARATLEAELAEGPAG